MNHDTALKAQADDLKARGDDDTLTIKKRPPQEWSRGVPLPMKDRTLNTYTVRFKSAKAIVVPDPQMGHFRIPYIVRYYPGDMKALLDALAFETGVSTFLMVNVTPDGSAKALSEVAGYPDPRDLREALHNYEEVTEEWETPRGETEAVDCLLVEWETDL